VLQDWRGWMEEGILDLNVPMAYFRQPVNDTDWAEWSIFAKNHRYNRHVALGAGIYLNSASNSLYQLRSTRTPTAAGHRADGLSGYSYAVMGTNVTRAQFLAALTVGPNAHDTNAVAIFSPVHAGRFYRLERKSDIGAVSWTALGSLPGQANAPAEGVIQDSNAPEWQSFYRLRIELSP
jgi:hypothetical protein